MPAAHSVSLKSRGEPLTRIFPAKAPGTFKEEYKPLTNEPIDETYIKECKDYTEKIIEISNDIIIYDLIKNDKFKEGTNE